LEIPNYPIDRFAIVEYNELSIWIHLRAYVDYGEKVMGVVRAFHTVFSVVYRQ
jgi:hypothetical protein